MKIPRHIDGLRVDLFVEFLAANGCDIKKVKSPFEVIRVKTNDKETLILYQKANGRLTWPKRLERAYLAMRAGKRWRGNGIPKRRQAGANTALRRGLWRWQRHECFFCGCPLVSSSPSPGERKATVEHLVPLSEGGPRNRVNSVLACHRCNLEAGELTVYEKIELRDRKRYGEKRHGLNGCGDQRGDHEIHRGGGEAGIPGPLERFTSGNYEN